LTERRTQFVRLGVVKQAMRLVPALVLLGSIAAYIAWHWGKDTEPRTRAMSSQTITPPASSILPSDARPTTTAVTVSLSTSAKLTPAKILQDTPPPELEYLEQLTALNHTDKQAALTWAEKGEEWYSEVGRNAEARRAMRVTLLVDLKRMDEARRFTRAFIAKYPDSPYRRLVQGVTGIHPRPSGPRAPTSGVGTPLP
jgi:hypothetical protein